MNENGEAESRSRTPSPLSRSSSRSSIGQSPARTSLLKRNQSLSAKQIRFYRNGDKYFVGLKLAVSSERYKEFFALLVELSNKLELKTGAVRFVFDADTGRLITDVGQLNPNSSYVCSSSNNFKEIEGGYGQSQSKNWSTGSSRDRHELTNWQKSNLPRMDNKRDFIKPKLVTVVKNGKPPQKKVTMLLNKKTALDLNQVLDHLSSKGTLGKVDRLCSLSGREIKELRDLFEEDMIFIAFSSNERFPEEGFDVDVQSPKQSWNNSIRPSRPAYIPSLESYMGYSWKDLPRARCLACALKALNASNTPPPHVHQRRRPKSAPPKLSYPAARSSRSDSRPSTASSLRSSLPLKTPKSPKISPTSVTDGSKSTVKSSTKKTPRFRSSYSKSSSPKSAAFVKKSLSFSPDTKDEEVDNTPKPKGIRGGGRRRKAQLALLNEEEGVSTNDPRHAYYVLIHDELKSNNKPTASVKPIMFSENDSETGKSNTAEPSHDNISTNNSCVIHKEEVHTSKSSQLVEDDEKLSCSINDTDQSDLIVEVNGEHHNLQGTIDKSTELGEGNISRDNAPVSSQIPDEKPANNNPSAALNDEKPSERDWSKPKPIRGRRKKPKPDMNGNEASKEEEKPLVCSLEQNVPNKEQVLPQQSVLLTNSNE